ncbi:hypothetical protein DSCA_14660 [Desulfosarcina alkanivorans]|uniref:Calcium-binding protein n=1 Tax=Desulfosarcina alkanivorans TaxID=571177 RepID=A0A5K7YET5_9BACT|nr:PD40 domain-containing protein [Desulfosarcina alkanivorans]BBO67536.1 hypothetical protein DSCA_14660 [Desulfosarcina alkanivorans]
MNLTRWIAAVNIGAMLCTALLVVDILPAGARTIERLDLTAAGSEGSGSSGLSAVNATGTDVAFSSGASNLTGSDFNGKNDIFVYDWEHIAILRVSVDNRGTEGDGDSSDPVISAGGRHVAFASKATNLVAGDTNGNEDIFIFDRVSETIDRASVDNRGTEGDGDSRDPVISAGGRYVAFASEATNLVVGDTNGFSDIFLHDRVSETIARVSVDGSGGQGNGGSHSPAISADGRYVTFASDASDLVAGDTNGFGDIFLHDRVSETVARVSVDGSGGQGNGGSHSPAISADGRYVAFASDASNLVAGDTNGFGDIFLYDRSDESVVRVNVGRGGLQGDQESREPAISADGRYIAFTSEAANLVVDDTNGAPDIFVADRTNGIIERISVDNSGVEGNAGSRAACLNENGDFIVFTSLASNLTDNDANDQWNIFVSIADTETDDDDGDDDDDDGNSGTIHFNCFISTIMGRSLDER